MTWVFADFELDTSRHELRVSGETVALEPQVFALLRLLIENADRVVTKDEIIAQIWNGRIVSDSALSSRVKTARQALGDDGRAQRFIRTHHGLGFRFVGEVTAREPVAPAFPAEAARAPDDEPRTERPSIAVLPFRLVGIAGPHAAFADALPHELIAELSRLRWLFVIARGSSFQFRQSDPDVRQIGASLGVLYCLSGTIEIAGDAVRISVELADTRDGGVIWSERFDAKLGDVHDIRSQIVGDVVGALELRIPLNEARRARLSTPDQIDAWSAYHLGLQQMYLFNADANARAAVLFERAIAIEPGFARAHAGLSFTRFQDAFLGYAASFDHAASDAKRFAERGVELDPVDPFANYTMGRALWLQADLDGGMVWLERATTLNPNYAQGVYARGLLETLTGQGATAQHHADLAMSLSPLDPLLYAMAGARSLSHLARGDAAQGAAWADKAARMPGAHILVETIAMIAHTVNGDSARAAAWAERVKAAGVTQADFFRAFPFTDAALRKQITAALAANRI